MQNRIPTKPRVGSRRRGCQTSLIDRDFALFFFLVFVFLVLDPPRHYSALWHQPEALALYAVAATWGVAASGVSAGVSSAAGAAGSGSAGLASSAAGSASLAASALVSAGLSSAFSAGFSAVLSLPRPLMVARSLAKGDGDLRFSVFTSLVSPLVAGGTSAVSAGAVAGAATSVERGSVASTAGMTGAVSETASAGASFEASASGFFLPSKPTKILPRFVGAGLTSLVSAGDSGSAAGAASASAGASVAGAASGSGPASASAGLSSFFSSFFSSFLPPRMLPKMEARLRETERRLGSSFFSSLGGSSLASSPSLATSSLAGSSTFFSSFFGGGAGLKASSVFLYVSLSLTDSPSSLASAILAFSWATQLSRSAALLALKVCLWPLATMWNLLAPSVLGSEASAWKKTR